MSAAPLSSVSSAPDALAPPPNHPRFPLLDGMRAIAVLGVVLVHVAFFASAGSTPLPRVFAHMNIGVTIFFLISGFLLYRPFIAHRAGGAAAPGNAVYLKRRALRIFPAYWAVLTVLTILPGTTGVSGGEWLGQYSLTFTLPFSGGADGCGATIECGLSQTWSLVAEATFYLALPLWVLMSNRLCRGRSPREWVSIELVGLAVVSVLSVTAAFGVADDERLITGTVLGFGLWFALGMGLAVVSVALGDRPVTFIRDRPWAFWLAAAGIYAITCAALPATPFLFATSDALAAHILFALTALLLMIPAVFGDAGGGWPRAVLANPVVAWFGLVSYGIFLWHYVVTVELGSLGDGLSFWPLLAATLAISIAAATASYYLLERPLLRLKYTGLRGARTQPSAGTAGR